MSMISYETDEVLVVTGQRDMGKSHFVRKLMESLPSWILYDVHDEHGPQGVPVKTINAIPEYWNAGYRKLRYVGPTDLSPYWQDFIATIWRNVKNTTVIVEEAELYFPTKSTPLKGYENFLVHRGRHRGLGLIAVSRRVADLHKDVLSQARTIVSFTQFLPNDLDYLRKFVGDEAKQLIDLPRFHFMVWREGKAQFFPPIAR